MSYVITVKRKRQEKFCKNSVKGRYGDGAKAGTGTGPALVGGYGGSELAGIALRAGMAAAVSAGTGRCGAAGAADRPCPAPPAPAAELYGGGADAGAGGRCTGGADRAGGAVGGAGGGAGVVTAGAAGRPAGDHGVAGAAAGGLLRRLSRWGAPDGGAHAGQPAPAGGGAGGAGVLRRFTGCGPRHGGIAAGTAGLRLPRCWRCFLPSAPIRR